MHVIVLQDFNGKGLLEFGTREFYSAMVAIS